MATANQSSSVRTILTPDWFLPFLKPARYKGIEGGRSSGKSHTVAQELVTKCIRNPDLSLVCIREIQKSLQFSAKRVIEKKIRALGASHLFDIKEKFIRNRRGDGIIIFEGMQDHTAESILSLEDFGLAWVEQAEKLSKRSLDLLTPTIRLDNPDGTMSEIWFTWNPNQPDDAVDKYFHDKPGLRNAIHAHVDYHQNPFLPRTAYEEMLQFRERDPDGFNHVWRGHYNTRSDAHIFSGKWQVDEFTPDQSWGRPYFGADWGFSQDPTVLTKLWIYGNNLYVEYEGWGVGIDTVNIPTLFDRIPDSRNYMIRADSSRPETINHVKNEGFQIKPAKKWTGNVEDGISFLRSFDKIIIHPRCKHMQDEARMYSYKICKRTEDILPEIVKKNDHCWDSIRYALDPLIIAKRREVSIRVI